MLDKIFEEKERPDSKRLLSRGCDIIVLELDWMIDVSK